MYKRQVIIASVELLQFDGNYIVRVRDQQGAEGFAVTNWGINNFYPVFIRHVGPFFIGKDARDLDHLINDCFLDSSHYKMQSMAIWTPIASAEFAILDLLGQVSGQNVRSLLGEIVREEVDVYWANNYRGQSAEESVRKIAERYHRHNPPAVKFKIAGRMGTPEKPVGRSEKMIPLLRKTLGDQVVIYADANGGYDVDEAIRIGKILEEIDAGFFEEPCPFYELWETKKVSDSLKVPVAAGEQESSLRRFRWMAANSGVKIMQPDLFYFGGLIRSIKVSRMADHVGLPCTPHVSGGGLNMLYISHYASIISNSGDHQEYKSPDSRIQYELSDGHIEAKSGILRPPSGNGLGFSLDPDWLKKGRLITEDDLI